MPHCSPETECQFPGGLHQMPQSDAMLPFFRPTGSQALHLQFMQQSNAAHRALWLSPFPLLIHGFCRRSIPLQFRAVKCKPQKNHGYDRYWSAAVGSHTDTRICLPCDSAAYRIRNERFSHNSPSKILAFPRSFVNKMIRYRIYSAAIALTLFPGFSIILHSRGDSFCMPYWSFLFWRHRFTVFWYTVIPPTIKGIFSSWTFSHRSYGCLSYIFPIAAAYI